MIKNVTSMLRFLEILRLNLLLSYLSRLPKCFSLHPPVICSSITCEGSAVLHTVRTVKTNLSSKFWLIFPPKPCCWFSCTINEKSSKKQSKWQSKCACALFKMRESNILQETWKLSKITQLFLPAVTSGTFNKFHTQHMFQSIVILNSERVSTFSKPSG